MQHSAGRCPSWLRIGGLTCNQGLWSLNCRHSQDKVEPPVYISDRRLVKSIQLLQVCLCACVRPCLCANERGAAAAC